MNRSTKVEKCMYVKRWITCGTSCINRKHNKIQKV